MFRKILLTILCLFVLSGSASGAVYFVSSADGDDTDDGTTMDNGPGAGTGAWATVEHALEAGGLSAGDFVFIRKTHSEIPTTDILPIYDGTAVAPITIMCWPRASHSISSSDWTNGNTGVVVDDADMDTEKHVGRWITAPDGFDYLITKITDASNIVIDRPYVGTTSANDATAVIKADEDWADDMGTKYGFDDSGWTIKETTWDADADDLPVIDFNDTSFMVNFDSDNYFWIKNLYFKDTSDYTILRIALSYLEITGCLFTQTVNSKESIRAENSTVVINRCIFDGGQTGIRIISLSYLTVKNSVIYGCTYGISGSGAYPYFENVNIGVETASGGADISSSGAIIGRDIILGGTNGEVSTPYKTIFSNYNKVLGAWKMFYAGGVAEKVAVTGTNANKKLSDNVIEITPNTTNTYQFKQIESKIKVFESRKTYDAGTYNVKVWIYNDTGNTLNDTTFSDDILMRCRAEAGSYGDATTEYVSMPWTYSDEIDILDAAVGGDDWDYLQCDSVVVGVSGSKIYCEVLVSTYDAQADVILIDPQTSNP